MPVYGEGDSELSAEEGGMSLSPSPPPPPSRPSSRPPSRAVPRWSDVPPYGDADTCVQCRRNNSVRSATTVNSYIGSSTNSRKDTMRSAPKLLRMPAEDEDSCPVILERDFHSMHRNVPGLRRRDVDTAAIRQHFYPEGGWGWIICGTGFVIHIFTTGLQLSFGLLYLHILHHVGDRYHSDTAWVGPLSLAVSLLAAPLVVAICRRKSTRLTAVLGGLVLALGCLFTSFAHQIHQIMLSYGIIMGVGISMVRETSSLMLGHYFKRKREFVEMVSQAGTGIGITLISVLYKEAVGNLGWRFGLQSITGILSLTFFLGLLYRSASLYHPQRRAIVHLKNQKKKIKEKKGHRKVEKPPLLDFSPLKIRSVQILLLASGMAAFGIYTPIFYLAFQGYKEGLEHSTLVLLETFLGFATTLGCVAFGLMVSRPSENCLISRQYLCQASLVGISISLLALSTVQGYHGYALFVWLYGICLGGFSYTLKMFTMERVRAKIFTKTWSFVQGAEAIPVLLGVPITGYINQTHPKAGYYFSFISTLLGAGLLHFVGVMPREDTPSLSVAPVVTNNNPRGSLCVCPPISPRHVHGFLPKSISFGTTMDIPDAPLLGCIAEERFPEYYLQCEYLRAASCHGHMPHRTLRACKSVPEGLSQCGWTCRTPRQVHVIEQMTTSV